MFKGGTWLCFFCFMLIFASTAHAGKVELTTYYPSAYGEYINLKSTADSYFATDSGSVILGGTGTSGFKLKVIASSGVMNNTLFTTNDYSASTGSAFQLSFGAASGDTYTKLQGYKTGGTAYGDLVLEPSGGNVGIGTTSPVGKLDVRGSLASTGWTAVTFGTGWANYGGVYQTVQYKKFGDFVYLRGLANTASAWSTYPTILTLPVGFRPAAQLLFCTFANSAGVRIDITTAGAVNWTGGGAGSGWLSLDGIFFSVD